MKYGCIPLLMFWTIQVCPGQPCFQRTTLPEAELIQTSLLNTAGAGSTLPSGIHLHGEGQGLMTCKHSEKFLAPLTPFPNDISEPDFRNKIRRRTWISGALYIPLLTTGYLMSHAGEPRNPWLFNTHKIASVSNLILLDVTTFQKRKRMGLSSVEKIAAVTMNVCFISTIATGGALSVGKPIPESVQTIHSITPWLTTIASGLLLYYLNNH
jgi:hypothetical protein